MANATASALYQNFESLVNAKMEIGGVKYSTGMLVAAAVVVISTVMSVLNRTDAGGIPFKAGIPFIGQWAFFTRRHMWLGESIKKLGNVFAFNILHHQIVVLSGEEGRNVFFNAKDLNLQQGYSILFGGAPDLKAIKVEREHEGPNEIGWFGKRLNNLLRRDRLEKVLPQMFQDLNRSMESWGASGQFDPFDSIYNSVFVLTIRALACRELADSPEAIKRVAKLYWDMEKAQTPTNVMLPWWPSKSRKRKQDATTELYLMIKQIVDERKEKDVQESDPMQTLIDAGDGVNDIVQFVLASLFAGIINTGINAAWMTLYLDANPKWKARVTNEIRAFAAKYSTPGVPLYQQLSAIPPQVWEEEMLDLELCLKETIRVTLTGALLRRHVGEKDIVIEGKKIKPGTFVAMPLVTAHHNGEIFDDPWTWNPDRYEHEEEKKEQYAFFGWGAGRHPCLGMRFAKLEIKTILALFLAQYDYEVVNKKGERQTRPPAPYRENLYQVPPTETVYVKYTKLADPVA